MSVQVQMLFHLFHNFFNHEELEWLASCLEVRSVEPLKCEHCIQVARGITLKMASPAGMSLFSNIQADVEKGIDDDLAELDNIEKEQMGKIQVLLDKHQEMLSTLTDPEERKTKEGELEQLNIAQHSIKQMIDISKKDLQASKDTSRLHLGNLWATLSQLPGMASC